MATRRKSSVTEVRGKKTGFELGAQVLKINVDALVKIYEVTVDVLKEGVRAGKANGPVGLMHTNAYFDLLHGGAYAVPINKRPFYLLGVGGLGSASTSKYFPGDISNQIPSAGAAGFIAKFFSGTSAGYWMDELAWNANVPHVFPKLLSDEAYMMERLAFSQSMTTALFSQAATGVSTLVEGISKGASSLGVGGDKTFDQADMDDALEAQARALLGIATLK